MTAEQREPKMYADQKITALVSTQMTKREVLLLLVAGR
jgi:hypothetical protein